MRFNDDAWDRWVRWIEVVKADLMRTINEHAILSRLRNVCEENNDWIGKHNGHYFCRTVVRALGVSSALGIRRQLKLRDDSVSLARLLNQMSESADQVTIDFYFKRFPLDTNYVDWQRGTFKTLSTNGQTLSQPLIAADLAELRRLNGTIETFVDRALAHVDARGSEAITFADIADSLAHFNTVARKYITFLTGAGYGSLEATVQFNWEQIFTVPLIEPRHLEDD